MVKSRASMFRRQAMSHGRGDRLDEVSGFICAGSGATLPEFGAERVNGAEAIRAKSADINARRSMQRQISNCAANAR